jgi:hypothetical protein
VTSFRVIHGDGHRWSDEGKVHAATWRKHKVWGWGWYAICAGQDGFINGRIERVPGRELELTVTCLRCAKRLVRLRAEQTKKERAQRHARTERKTG